jgi:hypothetical protein
MLGDDQWPFTLPVVSRVDDPRSGATDNDFGIKGGQSVKNVED